MRLLGQGGAQSELSVSNDDGLTAVTPGPTVTYTVTVANSGNVGATFAEVTDVLPPATTFVGCDGKHMRASTGCRCKRAGPSAPQEWSTGASTSS
jgi:uncharacterized repeat protein (TIGR01451 family)